MTGELTAHKITQRQRRAERLERFEDATEWPLLVLALLIIPLLILDYAVETSSDADLAIDLAFFFTWIVFALELSVRTYLSERRINYLARHWYDVLIVVVPFLRPLRIARSAGAVRALRVGRAAPFFIRVAASLHNVLRHRGLEWVLAAGVVAVLGCAALVLAFEQDSESGIDDPWTAMWWAMSTVTTVGYGDYAPVTAEGRVVAVLLMLVGIAFFSWVTANIAAFLVEFGGDDKKGVTTHDLMAKLETLETEIKALRAERASEDIIVEDSD